MNSSLWPDLHFPVSISLLLSSLPLRMVFPPISTIWNYIAPFPRPHLWSFSQRGPFLPLIFMALLLRLGSKCQPHQRHLGTWQNLGPHLRFCDQSLHFNMTPGWFVGTLKFEPHLSRAVVLTEWSRRPGDPPNSFEYLGSQNSFPHEDFPAHFWHWVSEYPVRPACTS